MARPPKDRFYVYLIFRPDWRPCYVGKGTKARVLKHFSARSHNPHLEAIIAAAGRKLPWIKIVEGLDNDAALEIEAGLIAFFGREVDGGPLVNNSDGGEGPRRRTVSEETRAKLRAARARLSPEWQAKNNAARSDAMRRADVREKIGAAMRGRTLSEEHCRKIGIGGTGRRQSPESIEKVASANRGTRRSEETRQKQSESRKVWYAAHPGQKRGPRDEATKAKLSAATRAYYARKKDANHAAE